MTAPTISRAMVNLPGKRYTIEGHADEPNAAIIDSQSVKTVFPGEERGYDAGKRVKGRKRFIAVDTLGLLLSVMVISAARSESAGGVELLDELERRFPKLRKVWADSGYSGELVEYAQHWCRFVLEIVKRSPEQKAFKFSQNVGLSSERLVDELVATVEQRLRKDYCIK